jgi:hypothetical protein
MGTRRGGGRSQARNSNTTVARPTLGAHTQRISFKRMATPRLVRNALMLSGETSSGLYGKKYRFALKGAKKATPGPPLVSASSNP